MADSTGTAPKQFRVLKDNGERWIMTFGGGHKGVRWDREDPAVDYGAPEERHRYAEPTPENHRAREWRNYIAERLLQILEESIEEAYERARPHIEEWLINTALPWLKTTAQATWTRLTAKKQASQPVHFGAPTEVRVTDVAPTSAVVLSERTNEHAQARSTLTPEEARQQLEDMELLTRLLAAKVRKLASSVIKEDGESDERFLDRRQQAEQLAVRNLASNIQVMLEQGTELGQALALSATYTPAFAAGRVEAGPLSIEGPSELQKKPRGH